ncbi:MAG: glycosyltransferase family 9 protein [Elusimicrobia bacterium]|nr:glycosyltransferase family 9 protein [Elusimicrobiota bacterium]
MEQIIKKILIIQLRRIGDVVFTLPVLDLLKRNFPNAQIDFLVEPPADELTQLNPNIHETLVYHKKEAWRWIFKIRKNKYDCVLDFHANGRSLLLTFFSGAPLKIGFEGPLTRKMIYTTCVKTDRNKFIVEQKIDLINAILPKKERSWVWDLKLPIQELKKAEQSLRMLGIGEKDQVIGLLPFHRHPIRAWKNEFFQQTALRLMKQVGYKILLLCGPKEKETLEKEINKNSEKFIIIETDSLIQMAALLKQCSCVIANDNGPQKIAMAVGTPTLTIFGPTNPLSINPNKFPHLYVRNEQLPCLACERNRCPYHHECMENLTPEIVLNKINAILKPS